MAIGEVSVKVVPDATDFWRSFRTRTSGQAEPEGRRQGDEFRRGFDAATAGGVKLKVTADTADARAKLDETKRLADALGRQSPTLKVKADTAQAQSQMHLLRDTILMVGPAAVPVAAVVGGALAGLIPTVATLALGIKGIGAEMKSGQLIGTQYATDIASLKDELTQVQSVAASGLLSGMDRALQGSKPLFDTVNTDIGQMSAIIGDIASGVGPALLSILTQLNPLFTTFGLIVDDGAKKLERWAQHGSGLQSFVAYVQAELPLVEHDIEQIVVVVAHLAEALAPMGHVALSVIGGISDALAAIPVPVLTALTSGALSAYAAFRTFQAVTGIVNRVSGAIESVQARFAAYTAQQNAAALQVAAASTEEAAAVARSKATEARAVADAAGAMVAPIAETESLFAGEASAAEGAVARITEAFAGMDSIFASQNEAGAAAALAFAANMETEATAAEIAAADIAASAATAQAAVDEAGIGAAAGWSAMLGPLAAVGVGVALLTTLFGNNNEQAQQNAKIMDGYANSLQQNANALADVNIKQTASNLQADGSIRLMNQLNASNKDLGLTYGTLALAVNGSQRQFDDVYNSLMKVAEANRTTIASARGYGDDIKTYNDTGNAAVKLAGNIKQLRNDMTAQMKVQQDLARIQEQAQNLANGGATATARQARALGVTSAAYLTAEVAAANSTAQTQAQTVAFQLENDAASLLSNALKSLAGQNLDVATAQTSFQQSTNSAIAALKKGKDAITGHSDAALADQQAVQGSVSAARQLADAVAKQSGSSDKAAASYRHSRDALLSQLKAQGVLTPAVRKYINTLFDVKGVSDYLSKHPTKHDVQINAAQAEAKTRQLQAEIDGIRQRQAIGVGVNAIEAENEISRIQGMIDALHGKTVTITTISADGGSVSVGSGGRGYNASAAGSASWTRDGKLPPGLSTVGERGWELVSTDARGRSQVFSHAQSVAMTGMPQALPGFAAGTGGIVHSGKDWIFNGHRYASERAAQNAEASAAASAAKAQAAAAAKAAKAQVQSTNALPPDVHSIFGALSGSVGGMRSAVAAFIKDFKAAGATTRQIARATVNDTLLVANQQKLVAARSKLANITTYGDTVRGALTGSFDPTKSGSVADLISGYKAQTGQNNAYTREVNALRKRAKGNKAELGLINSLAASGQTASLESLFSGSSKDLASAGKAYSGYNQSVQGGVDAASTAKYGETQGQASKDVQALKDVSVTLLNAAARLGAAVARSHGSSGARVEREMEKFAHEMETLVRHGRH